MKKDFTVKKNKIYHAGCCLFKLKAEADDLDIKYSKCIKCKSIK